MQSVHAHTNANTNDLCCAVPCCAVPLLLIIFQGKRKEKERLDSSHDILFSFFPRPVCRKSSTREKESVWGGLGAELSHRPSSQRS